MSTMADFLNMLPEEQRRKLIDELKGGSLILCDSLEEVLAAIQQLTKDKPNA